MNEGETGMWLNLDQARADSAHYSIMALQNAGDGMRALRAMFPEAKADDLNAVLFSTSGVHGTYCTIEAVEQDMRRPDRECQRDVTFLIVHPRFVALRYGTCTPETAADIDFLKRLRASSRDALMKVGF
jgi:hypothetical protein